MELTQEHFDSAVKNLATKDELKNLATKDDLKPLATKVDVREGVEDLARIIAETVAAPMQEHFDRLHEELTMRDRIEHLETDMQKIKLALRIS